MTSPTDPDDWRTEATAELFDAILSLGDREEAAAFFRDLCTRRELDEMSHRWHVAQLLAQGTSYRQISAKTGVSTATITRINQWLRHGRGGYHDTLARMGLLPKDDT